MWIKKNVASIFCVTENFNRWRPLTSDCIFDFVFIVYPIEALKCLTLSTLLHILLPCQVFNLNFPNLNSISVQKFNLLFHYKNSINQKKLQFFISKFSSQVLLKTKELFHFIPSTLQKIKLLLSWLFSVFLYNQCFLHTYFPPLENIILIIHLKTWRDFLRVMMCCELLRSYEKPIFTLNFIYHFTLWSFKWLSKYHTG